MTRKTRHLEKDNRDRTTIGQACCRRRYEHHPYLIQGIYLLESLFGRGTRISLEKQKRGDIFYLGK
jgi:hypothetical protein